jgi:hypothetical protein
MPRSAGGSTEVDEYSLDFGVSAADVDEFIFTTQRRYVPLAFAVIPGSNDCAKVIFALPKGVCHEANANTKASVLRKQVRAVKIISCPEGNWSGYHRNFVAEIEALKELAGTSRSFQLAHLEECFLSKATGLLDLTWLSMLAITGF